MDVIFSQASMYRMTATTSTPTADWPTSKGFKNLASVLEPLGSLGATANCTIGKLLQKGLRKDWWNVPLTFGWA